MAALIRSWQLSSAGSKLYFLPGFFGLASGLGCFLPSAAGRDLSGFEKSSVKKSDFIMLLIEIDGRADYGTAAPSEKRGKGCNRASSFIYEAGTYTENGLSPILVGF